jgi:hypothetical protein
MMSSKSQKAGRVEVNDLPQKEKELKDREAKEIRGGKLGESSTDPVPTGGKGGVSGGDVRM